MLTPDERPSAGDAGQITLLVLAYAAIAGVLVIVGLDASKVFLARRALSAAADSAALAGAEGVDTQAVYDGPGLRCGSRLPLSGQRAGDQVAASYLDAVTGLRGTFVALDKPTVVMPGSGTVSVTLAGQVRLPFGRLVGLLDPDLVDGLVQLSETSAAQSPVVAATNC